MRPSGDQPGAAWPRRSGVAKNRKNGQAGCELTCYSPLVMIRMQWRGGGGRAMISMGCLPISVASPSDTLKVAGTEARSRILSAQLTRPRYKLVAGVVRLAPLSRQRSLPARKPKCVDQLA